MPWYLYLLSVFPLANNSVVFILAIMIVPSTEIYSDLNVQSNRSTISYSVLVYAGAPIFIHFILAAQAFLSQAAPMRWTITVVLKTIYLDWEYHTGVIPKTSTCTYHDSVLSSSHWEIPYTGRCEKNRCKAHFYFICLVSINFPLTCRNTMLRMLKNYSEFQYQSINFW